MSPSYTYYVYGIQSGEFIKVGFTTSIDARLHEMKLYNPHPLSVVMKRRVASGRAKAVEGRIHLLLADYSVGREWFTAPPKLVQKAATVAIADVRREDEEWLRACEEREVQRALKSVSRGIDVECAEKKRRREIDQTRKNNKFKMLERLERLEKCV